MKRINTIKSKLFNNVSCKEKEMERQVRSIWITTLALAVCLLGAHDALAAGTRAGTGVDNMATITYEVNSAVQDVIESTEAGNNIPGAGIGIPTNFVVDTHINFTLTETDGAYVDVGPGATNQVLTFQLDNDGNYWQDFSLSVADDIDPWTGLADDFNATPVAIYVDVNDNDTYEPLTDTDTYVDELAEDADIHIFVVMSMPAVLAHDDTSGQALTAQVAQSQGGATGAQGINITADDVGNLDTDGAEIVFDTANGVSLTGTVNDIGAYRVQSAELTVAKDSSVISDPVGSAIPKAIPGAIVEYTVTVTNAVGAAQSATSISIADSLNTEIVAGDIAYTVGSIIVDAPNIVGSPKALGDSAVDGDEGDFTANTVNVTGIDLLAGESATVTFQVEIQ